MAKILGSTNGRCWDSSVNYVLALQGWEISLAPKHSHKSQMQQYASETSEPGEEGQRAV